MPIYYAVYTYISEPETYWWPLYREVPIQYAISLTWANIIGYALPTILMFIPWTGSDTVQNFESLWQVSPMLVPLLCSIFGRFYATKQNSVQVQRKAKEECPDIPHLKRLYIVTGILGLALHVYCFTKIISSPTLSLSSVFWLDLTAEPKAFGEGLKQLFLVDFWGFEFATYGWLCMAVWDVKRMGRTTLDIGKSSALLALSSFILGPGATMSAVWYWRENALARTIFTKG